MTSQDFKKRLDITGLLEVTGSELNQLVDTALPADDKGINIETQDSALDTPVVPNPDVELENITPVHWKVGYIWKRVPFDSTGRNKFYSWNPEAASDATYLQWEQIDSVAEEALATATSANANATQATLDAAEGITIASNALTTAQTAQTTANNADTNAETALAQNATQNTRLDAIEAQLEGISEEDDDILPVLNGGTGSSTVAGARTNIGLEYAPRGFTILKDVKSNGTSGGSFTLGDWRDRTINTRLAIGESGVSLNVDNTKFALEAGVYIIELSAPAYGVDMHQVRLYNVTEAVVVAYGTSEYNEQADSESQNRSHLIAFVTVTASNDFKIQHRCTLTNSTNGLGRPSALGGEEVFTIVKITRMK